jgi:hypothetical protein
MSSSNVQAEKRSKPFNRIVVLLDASGSFKHRQNEAIAKTEKLLEGLSTHNAKRWEQADEIKIISLDAIPETIWEGTPEQFAKTDKTEWTTRFKARSDYEKCTDAIAGLELALTLLESETKAGEKPTEKYLFAFTDFIHEPPVETPTKCQAPKKPSVPGDDFAWDRLADVKIAVFWMPPVQKMAWDRAMKDQGLTAYRLYTTTESAVVKLNIPEPAKRKVSETERQQGRETLAGLGDGVKFIMGSVFVVFLFIGLGIGITVFIRTSSRRSPVLKPAARVVNGPVAPMRIPRNPN